MGSSPRWGGAGGGGRRGGWCWRGRVTSPLPCVGAAATLLSHPAWLRRRHPGEEGGEIGERRWEGGERATRSCGVVVCPLPWGSGVTLGARSAAAASAGHGPSSTGRPLWWGDAHCSPSAAGWTVRQRVGRVRPSPPPRLRRRRRQGWWWRRRRVQERAPLAARRRYQNRGYQPAKVTFRRSSPPPPPLACITAPFPLLPLLVDSRDAPVLCSRRRPSSDRSARPRWVGVVSLPAGGWWPPPRRVLSRRSPPPRVPRVQLAFPASPLP